MACFDFIDPIHSSLRFDDPQRGLSEMTLLPKKLEIRLYRLQFSALRDVFGFPETQVPVSLYNEFS